MGVRPERVVLGHSGDTTDVDYLESVLRKAVISALTGWPTAASAPRRCWRILFAPS